MRRHGEPEGILSDNGKVFTGRFGPHQGEVLFDRICREHGIRHLLTAPASPTTTGKVKRFHKTLKREFLDGKVFASVAEAQAAIDAWVHDYNHSREHQSLGNRPPAGCTLHRHRVARASSSRRRPGSAGRWGCTARPRRWTRRTRRSRRSGGCGRSVARCGRIARPYGVVTGIPFPDESTTERPPSGASSATCTASRQSSLPRRYRYQS